MGGVPNVEDALNSDIYAIPVKRRQPKEPKNVSPSQTTTDKIIDGLDSETKDENLPSGWEKHEGK